MPQRQHLSWTMALVLTGCGGQIGGGDTPDPRTTEPSPGVGGPGPSGMTTPAATSVGGTPAGPSGTGAAPAVPPAGRMDPAPVVAPVRNPEAAAGESDLLRLPRPVYGAALTSVLQPLLGAKFDKGRVSNVVSNAPEDYPGESGYFEPEPPSGSTLRFFMESAEYVMGTSLATSTSLPCLADQGPKELTCIDAWITTTGRRAFRRPVAPEELADFRAQYIAVRDAHGRGQGLVAVLQTMLTAPDFIFAIEGVRSGARGDVVPLDGFEIATRLAAALWGGVPDDPLLDAAARGELSTAAGVEAAARRMLADKRSEEGLRSFASQWLHFSAQPLSEPRTEAAMLMQEVLVRGDGRLATLLTTRSVWMNTHLATRYTTPPPVAPTRETYVKAELPAERMGILTMSGVLRGNGSPTASPIKRGRLIRERLFCQQVPDAPDDVPPLSAVKMPATPTLRGKLEAHRSNPACAGCHSFIDPIGFAFENFDYEAKYQTLEGKVAVDAKGELKGTDVDGALDGAGSLIERLARSRMVKDCVTTQLFRFALGRREDSHDAAELTRLKDDFFKSDGNMREMLVALLRSEAFRSRRTREIPK